MIGIIKTDFTELIKAINENYDYDGLLSCCLELKGAWVTNRALLDFINNSCDMFYQENQALKKLITNLENNGLLEASLRETDEFVNNYIDALVVSYKYRKLPKLLSYYSQELYKSSIAEKYTNNNISLFSSEGTLVSNGFERIVVGDYGAFFEISKDQIVKNNLCCKKGEEYRYKDKKYSSSVKYFWYTVKDVSDIKIYYQQKKVTYADYIPFMFYVSPYEVSLINKEHD